MKKYIFTSPLVLIIVVILQSTILNKLEIKGIKPDFILICQVIFSNYFGKFKGELAGAAVGIVEDLLSSSPLGFNTFIRTITGYLAGITKGKVFLDPLVTPVVLVLVFSILKELVTFILLFTFLSDKASQILSVSFFTKIILNMLFTPLILFILKILKLVPKYDRYDIL